MCNTLGRERVRVSGVRAGHVTLVLTVLVATALIAGCAHGTRASSPSGSATTTYTNAEFHFSIAYGPGQFEASQHPMPENAQFSIVLHLRGQSDDPYVGVSTARASVAVVNDMLGQWSKAEHTSWDGWIWGNYPTKDGWTWDWATLGGARGMRFETHKGGRHEISYLLFHGDQGYSVELGADVSEWSAVEPQLNAVAQSFTVTN